MQSSARLWCARYIGVELLFEQTGSRPVRLQVGRIDHQLVWLAALCRQTREYLVEPTHGARRGKELGIFNRVVSDDQLANETQKLIELLLIKNQQGLRQLKFMINKNVEADLYTAQGFEALGSALSGAINGSWRVPDADGTHGWVDYTTDNPGSAIRRRRELSKDFWVD
jgi:enoyl-CoA hydratase